MAELGTSCQKDMSTLRTRILILCLRAWLPPFLFPKTLSGTGLTLPRKHLLIRLVILPRLISDRSKAVRALPFGKDKPAVTLVNVVEVGVRL